jgi:hypothetical protein
MPLTGGAPLRRQIASQIDKEPLDASPNSATRLRKYYVDHSLLWLIFRNSPQAPAPGEAKLTAQTVADLGGPDAGGRSNQQHSAV